MESSENNENQGFSSAPHQHGWNNMSSPLPDMSQKPNDIPIYFNTTQDNTGRSNTPSTYPQPQKSPAVSQATSQGPIGQNYPDGYRYHQHVQSPGPGRSPMRMPGQYPGTPNWPNSGSPAPAHPPYMSPDRGRAHARPPYPQYDPSKSYSQPPLPGQPQWQRAPYPSPHPAYNHDPSRMNRYGQPDVAGPVVPAGLQALQANNNNATLMQHQHTPMLVPNPHYNQNRMHQGHDAKPHELAKIDQPPHTPQRPNVNPDGSMFSPTSSNPPTPGYYPSQHPQHSNTRPMHHQMGLQSPNVSPYPASTPSSKGKARGNKSYQCPKCVKVFRRGDHLKRHLLSVHDHEHPYQCGECGKGFASVPALLKHAKSLHVGQLAKGLMCLRCHITFASLPEIEAHASSLHVQEDEIYMQSINTSSKQHICSSCPKSFTSAANLKRHVQLLHRSKDDTKMYCRECGKSFARIEALRKHVDKMHNGNPSAMPPADELEDAETLSQTHSSESESRGPSADTDETSVPMPPGNNQWGYPTSAPQPAPSHAQPMTAPPPVLAYQQHTYQQQPHLQPPLSNQPSSGAIPTGGVAQQSGPPIGSAVPLPAQKPPSQIPETKPQIPDVRNPQDGHNLTVSSSDMSLNGSNLASLQSVTTIQSEPIVVEPVEPKSVSEALSMAMKALSDFDYETPGFEMYPYPSTVSLLPPPAQYHHRVYVQQNQMLQNGVNGQTRTHNSAPMPYGGNTNYDFSRHSGNFLMTVPPPPGSMTLANPQHVTRGVSEATQLSQLLQEGGGGVKIPTHANNINNSNSKRQVMPPQTSNMENVPIQNGGNSFLLDDATSPASNQQNDTGEQKIELVCSICKIEYNTIDELMVHIEGVHLKKNPHECCMCNKQFAQAGNVKRHIRFVHLRERPFRCKDCSCTFDRLCYLQRHMRTHLQLSDENQEFNPLKPCTCPECGKRCLTAHHLRGHMQRKHFAKNKQNYAQFLAKYSHLEALGTGPGALTNPKGRKGRKKKDTEGDMPIEINGFTDKKAFISDNTPNSSPLPDSSNNVNALSNVHNYNQYSVQHQKTPLGIQFQNGSYPNPQPMQGNFESQMQLKVPPPVHRFTDSHNFNHVSLPAVNSTLNHYTSPGLSQGSIGLINLPQSNPGYFNVDQFITQSPVVAVQNKPKISVKRRRNNRRTKKLLPFRCSHCVLRSFPSLAMLKSHCAVAHNKKLKRCACRKCGVSFSKSVNLKSHMRKNHNRKKATKSKIMKISNSVLEQNNITPSTTPPLYQPQQNQLYAQNMAHYSQPRQVPYYSFDPNSPAMVPSPNVQMPYATPAHVPSTHMPLIQT